MFVDHFFFVDEMRGLLDEVHEVGHVVGPIVEALVCSLVLVEVHNSAQPVSLGLNCAWRAKRNQLSFK